MSCSYLNHLPSVMMKWATNCIDSIELTITLIRDEVGCYDVLIKYSFVGDHQQKEERDGMR